MRFTFLRFVWISLGSSSVLLLISFLELKWMRDEEKFIAVPPSKSIVSERSPTYAVYGHDLESGYLQHVFETFEAFGFVRRPLNSNNWDVLWAHDYPFHKLHDELKRLRPTQKVNHFPGTGFITNKVDLAKTDSVYIPKAFEMPMQKDPLFKYVANHPKKMFVQKSNDHRGIRIEQISSLNLTSEGTFVQEFVDKPLLIDGHKFDVGVYTIITSIEPLRVYVYNGDAIFRFCPEKYHPFDPNNKHKYVVGDNYLPMWQVPSLKKYFVAGSYSMKESFNTFIRVTGRSPELIWAKIEDAIRTVVLLKEPSLLRIVKRYPSKRNFFEMVRFDFAIDEDFNVFVMEANMSPNLSSAHFPPNKLIYYQVLFNLFCLVGLTNYSRRLKEDMDVSMKNLMVSPEHCNSNECNNCFSSKCQLCWKCLSEESIEYLKSSYREHNNRQDCKRIFPPSEYDLKLVNSTIHQNYSPDNLLLSEWFHGKCLMDRSWC